MSQVTRNAVTSSVDSSVETKPTYLQLISQDEKTVQAGALKLTAQSAALELNREILDLSVKISAKKADATAETTCS